MINEETGIETRNIIDPEGNVIGSLGYPIGTSEAIWEEQLSMYATPIPTYLDITNSQLRQAIVLTGGILADIDLGLTLLEDPQKVLYIIEWEFAVTFSRYKPLTIAIGQILNKSEQEMDAIWRLGESL